MAKIQTYALTDSPLLLSDMLIGTEMDGLIPFATKNFSLGQLYSFFSSLDPFFDLQYVLDNGNVATQNIYLTGYMEINGELKPDIILDENNSPGLFGQALIRSASGLIWADINPASTLQDVLDNGNTAIQDMFITGRIESTILKSERLEDESSSYGNPGDILTATPTGYAWSAPPDPNVTLQDVLDNGNTAIGNLILDGTIIASVIKPGNILDQGNASGNNGQVLKKDGLGLTWSDVLSSVGLSMPSAFTVTNSPLTSDGIIYVTGAGLANQYIRGDGTLANFPSSSGGGSSVSYYLNGSVNQGTFGGDVYYEMSKTPIFGAGTNFTRTNAQGNGYIASFITDAGDPSLLSIPGGNWNLEFYFQASSGGGSPQFYAEIYKVSATNVFTLVASGSTNPEGITNGTTVDQYFTSVPVPQTTLLVTDRLAVRVYVITSGRTITLHTEDNNLCQVITTFSTGLNALNGLTAQVQYFATGSSGTDFNISSSVDTHTFNLPVASSVNTGKLSFTDWNTFNEKPTTFYQNTTPTGTGTSAIIEKSFWTHSNTGLQYTYIYDGNTYQWVQVTLPLGPQGPQGANGTNAINSLTATTFNGLLKGNGATISATDVLTELGYTPENVANKEDVTLDSSSTKYPTNNLVKTSLDNFSDDVDYAIMTNQRLLFNF
jgi:hypothetical protein